VYDLALPAYGLFTNAPKTSPSKTLAFSHIPMSRQAYQPMVPRGLRVESSKSPIFSEALTGLRLGNPKGIPLRPQAESGHRTLDVRRHWGLAKARVVLFTQAENFFLVRFQNNPNRSEPTKRG